MAHDLSAYPWIETILNYAVRYQIRGEKSKFDMHNLRKVAIEYYDTENGMSTDVLVPFLRLKSLVTCYANRLSEGGDPNNLMDYDREGPFVAKELILNNAKLDMVDIFLEHFPYLERLFYRSGDDSLTMEGDFEPSRFMPALQLLRSCLRDLTLLDEQAPEIREYQFCPIGSFADFDKLTSLDLPAVMMVGQGEENDAHYGGEFPRWQSLT